MDKRLTPREDRPCFYAAIVLYFPIDTPRNELMSLFRNRCSYKHYDRDNRLEVTVCEVDNIFCWEVAEVLTQLFEECDLESVNAATEKYKGSVFIDISFVHKDRYPALVFEGKAMQIIHQLQASIGIDPYQNSYVKVDFMIQQGGVLPPPGSGVKMA